MINVDISNVWGQLDLPDLLAIEAEAARAHTLLTEDSAPSWLDLPLPDNTPELDRIRKAAEQIRRDCEVCVVTGTGAACLGSRAVIELLQGANHNLNKGNGVPQIFFTGSTLSTRHWQELQRLLEGKDICLIVISASGTTLEPAIAFRGLRWMLERKYGTDEANRRIFAVTDTSGSALSRMAAEEGWQVFDLPARMPEEFSVLTAAGLLPMAVAGIDVTQLLEGAAEAKEAFAQGSFDSPVWLYAAIRNLLNRTGKTAELLETFEPDFRTFGQWWQQLFGASEGRKLLTIPAELMDVLWAAGQGSAFETILRFGSSRQKHIIGPDVKDLDELNFLSGKNLDQVQEQVFFRAVEHHADSGVPVITIDCPEVNARTAGELLFFLLFSCAVSGCIQGSDPFDRSAEAEYRQSLLRTLGKPDRDDCPPA